MRAVLTFHSIDSLPGPLSYPPAALQSMLDALSDAGVPVLSLDELLADNERSGIALTFDDGLATVFSAAMPILRERKVPAHVFTITKWIGGNNRWPGQPTGAPSFRLMDWSQLEAIQEAGFLIEAHTASHPDLRILHDAAIEDEMGEADTIIESRLGRRPRYFAYPYGHHDARVRALASKRYRGCFTTKLDYMGPDTAFDAIPRLDAHYLRSMKLVRSLAGKPAQAYIGLRRALRRLKGH